MIHIDFMGGLHGNFLCYCINALDNRVKQQNPFTVHGTSHRAYDKPLAVANHYTAWNMVIPGNDIVSITCQLDDCLLINLLSYGRAGDYNFDLKNFNRNFAQQLSGTEFADTIEHLSKTYHIPIGSADIPRGLLREYYKFNFARYENNNIMQMVAKQKYPIEVFEFQLRDFYDFDRYMHQLHQITKYFDLTYQIDAQWYHAVWCKFIEKNQALVQEQQARAVLDAIAAKQFKTIDFNLLQESWLNARLELLYNTEMPFEQEEYFKDTHEIMEFLQL